ncbi:uncharacterized protein LOC121804115 [Salvia splendens]|uniref:uncharacterized protein LOC121804115 n=1 Tax=Salvia splendens TaxID=180675 RepID=UPI001C280D3D|nr:uncharacterized protein LOC121804115 [Salvia splendens]
MAVDLVMNCRNSSFVSQSVDKFKKVMSFVGWARTGHARFRRAPFSRPRGREDLLPHPHPAGSGGGEHELLLLLCRLADFFFLRLQEEVLFVGKRHVLQEEGVITSVVVYEAVQLGNTWREMWMIQQCWSSPKKETTLIIPPSLKHVLPSSYNLLNFIN